MKKLLALMLAAALALSLMACGGGGADTSSNGNEASGTSPSVRDSGPIESKGLFILEAKENFDLSNEKELSEHETYLVHVYDIIPDAAKNADISKLSSDFTVTLNNTNTYESTTASGGAALISFVYASRYKIDRNIGTIFAGSSPIRTISIFRINKNDINDNTTVKFEREHSDIYNCSITFGKEDITTIDMLDKVFSVEENPSEYQLASTMFIRNQSINNAINYLNNNGGTDNSAAVASTLAALETNVMMRMSACLDGNANVVYYDYNSDTIFSPDITDFSGLEMEELINAVNNTYPEISESTTTLFAANIIFVENLILCSNPDTYTEEALQQANLALSDMNLSGKEISEFFTK